MKLTLLAGCVLSSFLVGAGNSLAATPDAGQGASNSILQLKQSAPAAHTPEQNSALASHYQKQHDDFARRAAEEKLEWERRSQNIVLTAAKYPRPVDSARYLYEYYSYKANEAGRLAARYGQGEPPETPSNSK